MVDIDYKIYIPVDKSSIACVSVLDHNTLRVYDNMPDFDSSSTYTDYFLDSHYLSKVGSESFTTTIPVCISSDLITNDFYYRYDIDSILIVFVILLLFIFGIPYKMLTIFLRRWK